MFLRIMNRQQLIKKYMDYFKTKNHKEIPSASLIPENDPTTLFISAGMHPLVPYLLGQKHPLGKRIVDVQKCIRTGDIEEVGNETHHTFFEMLGNWSLGDYWKKQAIEMSFEFLTKILKIPKEKLAVSCFKGDENAPKDIESKNVWKSFGIPSSRIAFLGKEDNWWGPAGKTGPCGPDTEMFYWKSKKPTPKEFNPNNENWVEIWNDVFMQYSKYIKEEKLIKTKKELKLAKEKGFEIELMFGSKEKKYKIIDYRFQELKQKNVDTGMGVERTLAVLNNLEDNYLTDVFKPIIQKIEKLSGKKYVGNEKAMRIIADHIKASVFIISEGIVPSNTEQGYVLRRLIRRAIRYGKEIGLEDFTKKIAEPVFQIYEDYSELKKNKKKILEELEKEEEKFEKTLDKGLNKLNKICKTKKQISCKDCFLLYQSYGFPIEMTIE